ncbi:hypothetical protein [Phocaeicola dorei]|jgi:hypothetical protein|uniref:hypothetical protein n=1 Tax=Phocaeicola dorei TaxID=357276 RepID=UPI0023CCD2ED|nr:hypothetical protein [Bacteroides acidifaciens]
MKQMIEMIKQIVENIELIFYQCSPQPHRERHFIKSRSVELQCHVLDEGRRKNTLSTDMDIAAHAIA